ncbi:MAG: rod shape-determining protein MreC [Paludibacteraceae bacterium]
MSALLRFFVRFSNFFEFVLLELIALLLVVHSGAFRQSVFYRANTAMVGSLHAAATACSDYFSLQETNARLVVENEQLLNKIAALETYRPTAAGAVLSADSTPSYCVRSAAVVYSTVNRIQNLIIIDKGSVDGIAANMGVVNADGVVGVVDAVSKHYAVVMPIINIHLQVSGRVAKNGYLGSVHWDGLSPEFAELTEIPPHVDVAVGDTVVTSGYSAVFAGGVPIGVVDRVVANDNRPFSDIRVRLMANYRTLEHVHVVDCSHRDELLFLVDSLQNIKK